MSIVRRLFIDLLTPAELDALAALSERVLRHLAEEPFSEEPAPGEVAPPRRPARSDHAAGIVEVPLC